MRRYIALCRRRQPVVPDALTGQLVNMYVELRRDARNNADTTFTSPRVLLAVIRMATALARLRLSDIVNADDVQEAMRLMEASKESLRPPEDASRKRRGNLSAPIDAIYRLACDMRDAEREQDYQSVDIGYDQLVRRAETRGYQPEQVRTMIDTYTRANVLMEDNGRVVFV